MGKADGNHTPKRKRQRATTQRDQDDAKTLFVYPHLVSPRRAAEQERLRQFGEKHGLAEAQERLRLFGEKHGLKQFAEAVRLRNAERAEPRPPEPTPQRKRKSGGGNKRMLPEETITDWKAVYNDMLAKDPTWAENKMASAKRVIELLKLGNSVSVWTVKRWIVEPVLKEREQNKLRR